MLKTRSLTSSAPSAPSIDPLASAVVEVDDDPIAFYELSLRSGWGDGLPVVPPTEERVRAVLAGTPYHADDVVAVLPPGRREATVELVAINAVLAGCEPAGLPLVIAALEALSAPEFNAFGITTTTSGAHPMLIVNGPSRDRLGIDYGPGCMGGAAGRGSMTIGRAVSLCLRNVGGQRVGTNSKSVFGQPARTGLCFAEWEERSPWPSLACQLGFGADEDVVTVHAGKGTFPMADTNNDDALDLLYLVAKTTAFPLSNNYLAPSAAIGQMVLAFNPLWAERFGRVFPDVVELQGYLWEHCWQPIDLWPAANQRVLEANDRVDDEGRVRLCARPDQLVVIVCGGLGGLHAVCLPSWADSELASRAAVHAYKGALAGLRVLDLSNLFSGPSIAAILADFGADVVKVEPPEGDPLRFIGAQRAGKSLPWAMAGRNKRTIIVDPAKGDVLIRLTGSADVVVVNQPRRLLEQWRCTPEEIAARNPRAVVVWATAYGATGPYADRPGNGTLGEAFGGLTHMIGEPDGPPVLPSAPVGDMLTAIVGALGALAACFWRDTRGGEGQVVDVSMFEPPLALLSTVVAGWLPAEEPPRRTGSRVPGGVPRNTYQTGEGRWVVLSGTTDAQVARILPIIGLDGEEGRARFARSEQRLAHGDELDALVARWIAGHGIGEVLAAFLGARIPITEVNDLATLVADPHVQARGSVVSVPDTDMGDVLMPAPVPRLSRTPASIGWTGRAAGADTDAVCQDWLGADGDEVAALRSAGAVR